MLTCESLENSEYGLSPQKQPHWEMASQGKKKKKKTQQQIPMVELKWSLLNIET